MNFDALTYATPYKLGQPVMACSGEPGAYDENCVDGPVVFWHGDRFHMIYTGFDGKSYQSALATSRDLIHWEKKGVILGRSAASGRWDGTGCAATTVLRAGNSLYETPALKKIDGKYVLLYHSYPAIGYEEGPAEIGLAFCEDESLMNWERLGKPVFSYRDGADWECGGLYKACLLEHEGLYYMFYNAKDCATPWTEQTGLATSRDLLHWERHADNPVLKVTPGAWDSQFCSDPHVLYDPDKQLWLMFYFGLGGGHAQDGVAYSKDLLRWEKHPDPLLRHGTGDEIDATHAHKPYMLYHNGTLYHYYCACRPMRPGDISGFGGVEFRCISVAASRDLTEKERLP